MYLVFAHFCYTELQSQSYIMWPRARKQKNPEEPCGFWVTLGNTLDLALIQHHREVGAQGDAWL